MTVRATRVDRTVRPKAVQRRSTPTAIPPAVAAPHGAMHPAAGTVPLGPANGLPAPLKTGMERVSGVALDDVRVFRNSVRPARLQAHAFAQGRDIHLAPGQDRHLPHELAHVVQQKQGRVPVTGRIGDTALNDDATLEAEADRMGRAATASPSGPALAATRRGSPERLGPRWIEGAAPAQRVKARSHTDALWKANLFAFQKESNWIRLADQLETEIAAVNESIADYTDGTKEDIRKKKKALRKIEDDLDDAIDDGNALMSDIDDDNAAFLENEDELRTIYIRVRNLMADFQKEFLPAGGGFSASARSTPIANVKITLTGQTHDAPFLRDTRIGARTFGKYKVAKPATAPDPGKIVLRSGSTYYDDDDYAVGDTLPAYPHHAFSNPMASSQNAAKKFHPRVRETTQDGAMSGVSARTYAWMSNTPGWDTQKWEWLHLRAASLGGATNAQNLVLGTRDANTQMMPFESNLVRTANALSGTPRYQGITVKWAFEGQDPTFKYKVRKITITWVVHLAGHDNSLGGKVTIYPLDHKPVLSRNETNFLEDALEKERTKLHGHATVPLPKPSASGGGTGGPKKKQKIK